MQPVGKGLRMERSPDSLIAGRGDWCQLSPCLWPQIAPLRIFSGSDPLLVEVKFITEGVLDSPVQVNWM